MPRGLHASLCHAFLVPYCRTFKCDFLYRCAASVDCALRGPSAVAELFVEITYDAEKQAYTQTNEGTNPTPARQRG